MANGTGSYQCQDILPLCLALTLCCYQPFLYIRRLIHRTSPVDFSAISLKSCIFQFYGEVSQRAVILAGAVAGSLALYFFLSLYVFPQSLNMEPRRPEAVVTSVDLPTTEIKLGASFIVSVNGTNRGEDADMQLISVSFPNLTRTENVQVLKHDFRQTPTLIKAGGDIGSQYAGTAKQISAKYAAVEASSRPWPRGAIYSLELQVKPEHEGRFSIFVKSVAFPHSWDGANWPHEGSIDYQKELVKVYYVNVAKP